jgi:thioredoxin-dependent peroxiredoxin
MNENLPKKPPKPSDKSANRGSGRRGCRALACGDKAPNFDLSDDAGGKVSLASFRDRLLVLYFYPKDDTSGCTKEAIDFNALRGEFQKAGAAVLGVSADSVASHARFKAKHKLELILGSDDSKAMLTAYGVWVEKSMYGRKYMGIERTTFLIGKDGKILAAWNNVKVPGHAAAVLAAVKAL